MAQRPSGWLGFIICSFAHSLAGSTSPEPELGARLRDAVLASRRQMYSLSGVGAVEERWQDSRTEGQVGWRHPKWMGREGSGEAPRTMGTLPGRRPLREGGQPAGGRAGRRPRGKCGRFGARKGCLVSTSGQCGLQRCPSDPATPGSEWLPVPQERALVPSGPLSIPAHSAPQARLSPTRIKSWALLLVLGMTFCPATPWPSSGRPPTLRYTHTHTPSPGLCNEPSRVPETLPGLVSCGQSRKSPAHPGKMHPPQHGPLCVLGSQGFLPERGPNTPSLGPERKRLGALRQRAGTSGRMQGQEQPVPAGGHPP